MTHKPVYISDEGQALITYTMNKQEVINETKTVSCIINTHIYVEVTS